ncbi:MAG TPA: LptF/LptG family permease [Verrucomicrobiae bacterium]|jgi:lipopolysaccharide export system permease protein|nr:LptF/LptG family permease [Verrucomicrobiae bacterium]
MRLLDRYLLRELLTPLAYCLSGFLIFYVAFDLIFRISQFQDAHLQAFDVVKYYVVTLPGILADLVIPVSLLLALLYALTNHGRHNELVAMRAAGVGVWRIAAPYLAVGAALGVVVLFINEVWAPQTADRARELLQGHKGPARERMAIRFRSDDTMRDWVVDGGIDPATGDLLQPQVRWTAPQPGAPQRIHADRAAYHDGQWIFSNADVWMWGKDQSTISSNYPMRLPETPAWIRTEIKLTSLSRTEAAKRPQLSIGELSTYLRLHPNLGADKRAIFQTQLQGRIAGPFTCLAVVMIAFPLGAKPGRRNVFVGVANSIFICFAYFILQRVCFAFGTSGDMPPALAAWLPNLLCVGAGLALMTHL